MYSGDLTSAYNGAVEYLYAQEGLRETTLVYCNIYRGDIGCDYKIIVGSGDDISRKYMMNPNNRMVDIKCKTIQRQTILGVFIPEEKGQSFVILNVGNGNIYISESNKNSLLAIKALFQRWSNTLYFNDIVKLLGAQIVDTSEKAEIDFSLDNLEKDSFIKLFLKY